MGQDQIVGDLMMVSGWGLGVKNKTFRRPSSIIIQFLYREIRSFFDNCEMAILKRSLTQWLSLTKRHNCSGGVKVVQQTRTPWRFSQTELRHDTATTVLWNIFHYQESGLSHVYLEIIKFWGRPLSGRERKTTTIYNSCHRDIEDGTAERWV